MDDWEVGKYWDDNAEAWKKLSSKGLDVYRDFVNTPAFLAILPDIKGLKGIDIGCGEGNNTRLLAKLGAKMHAIDISKIFIKYAKKSENEEPLGIKYQVASASDLPFEDESFEFATAFMSLMDIPDHQKVLSEVYRVLKSDGFFQFSITHPCFSAPYRKLLRDDKGHKKAIAVADYFLEEDGEIEEWIFSLTSENDKKKYPKFKVPRFHRTLSTWFNTILTCGFKIEKINEPFAADDVVKKCPAVADTRIVAYFLHIRCRK